MEHVKSTSASNKVRVFQSNALTEGRYDFNLIEKRIMYGILVKCREKFIDNQNEGQKDLFNDLVVYLPMADLMKSETNKKRVYEAAVKMRAKVIEVRDDKRFLVTGFINYAEHKLGSDVLEIGVSKHILPHVAELVGSYTTFELTVAITLKSVYTQRLYEICNKWKSKKYAPYSMEELRAILYCEDKFKKFGEFRRGVLDLAQRELKASYDDGICDLYFTWKPTKTKGKLITDIGINITSRNDRPVPTCTPDDLQYFIKTQLTQYFPTNKGFVKNVLKRCEENFELAEEIQKKITKICSKYSVKERPAVMKHVIEMDFEIS